VCTEAFNEVFKEKEITLRDDLMVGKTVSTLVSRDKLKDTSTPNLHKTTDEELLLENEQCLATYTTLGCFICFSHDCVEHAVYNTEGASKSSPSIVLEAWSQFSRRIGRSNQNSNREPPGQSVTQCVRVVRTNVS
jgi:hypothetical protein